MNPVVSSACRRFFRAAALLAVPVAAAGAFHPTNHPQLELFLESVKGRSHRWSPPRSEPLRVHVPLQQQGQGFAGDIASLMICRDQLAANDRIKVRRYLKSTYDLDSIRVAD